MLARTGARRVIGFASAYLREPLARVFYREVHDPGRGGIYHPDETRHVVEVNLGLLAPLGISVAAPEFPIERVESEVARRIADETGGSYVLLNPCAAWPNKRWPAVRFAETAAAIQERRGLRPVVLWGPGERALAEEVVAAAQGAALLSPPTSIADVVALARGAALMISGDTGPTHIAAAVGTPLVGVFGPTRPSRNGPWLPADVSVTRDAVCRCHHLRQCRLPTMCLLDVQVSEMLAAVDRRLGASQAPPRPAALHPASR